MESLALFDLAKCQVWTGVRRLCRKCGKNEAKRSQFYCSDDCRFWDKVRKGPGCWEWTAALTKPREGGWYGQFQVRVNGKHQPVGAHVYAYRLAHGWFPEGLCVLHKCDNPKCVRVGHLFLGTQADNVHDAALKGRYNVPHKKRHKLTADQIADIRSRVATGPRGTVTRLAAEYGVTLGYISLLVRGVRRQYDAPLLADHRKAG